MLKKYADTFLKLTDLHDEEVTRKVTWILVGIAFLLAVVVRKSLIHFQNPDYTIIASWYDLAKVHGIHVLKYGYGDGFSNYNPPFSYFLYIATLLPVSKIVAIKGMMAFFDVVLAVSVYCVLRALRPRGFLPLAAALATLFLPTVLVTGVMWGQFDQFYVAFVLFSLWAGLTGRSRAAWALFGIALSIKFQAIFFLPVLGVMLFKKIRWYDAVWGIGSFLLVTLPPVLVGRSAASLINIYPDQAKLFNGFLVLNAPNVYQWVPNSMFPYLNNAGICLAIMSVLCILLAAIWYKKFSNRDLLVATTLVLYIVPFLLPAMHERYFFPAGIASMVLAFAYPTVQFVSTAVLMQVITLFSYEPFLFNTQPAVPFGILALGILYIICVLGMDFLASKQEPSAAIVASAPKRALAHAPANAPQRRRVQRAR